MGYRRHHHRDPDSPGCHRRRCHRSPGCHPRLDLRQQSDDHHYHHPGRYSPADHPDQSLHMVLQPDTRPDLTGCHYRCRPDHWCRCRSDRDTRGLYPHRSQGQPESMDYRRHRCRRLRYECSHHRRRHPHRGSPQSHRYQYRDQNLQYCLVRHRCRHHYRGSQADHHRRYHDMGTRCHTQYRQRYRLRQRRPANRSVRRSGPDRPECRHHQHRHHEGRRYR